MKICVVYPYGPADWDVANLLVDLASHDLLHPFGLLRQDGTVDIVRGRRRTSGQVDDQLARLGALELVRLLVLNVDGVPMGDGELGLVSSLADRLSANRISTTRGVVAYPLHGEGISRRALSIFWNYNIVMVPEDGLGEPNTLPVPMTDPSRRSASAASAVALVGGLWRFLPESPLDDIRIAGDGNIQRLRLGRLTTRVVDAGDLTQRTIEWATATGTHLPAPPGCVRHGEPERAVEALADALAPRSGRSPIGFGYQPAAPVVRTAQTRLGIVDAIKRFFGEVWLELKPMPRHALMGAIDRTKARVERAVQEKTYGVDSDIVVSLRRPKNDQFLANPSERSAQIAGLPGLQFTGGLPAVKTWDSFSRAVLAAVDGGELPQVVGNAQLVWAGQRAVIGNVGLIAAPSLVDEGSGAVISEREMHDLGWVHIGDVVVEHSDPATLELILAGPQTPEREQESGKELPPPRPATKSAPAIRTRLAPWLRERQDTLMWKIAARIAEQQLAALEDLERTQAAFEQSLGEMQEIIERAPRLRRRFVRRALLLVLLIVASIAAALVVPFMAPASVSLIVVGVAVLLIGSGLTGMYRLAANRVRWRHRLRDLQDLPEALLSRRQQAASEYQRLASLYGEFQDWSRIIAAAIHRPWGVAVGNTIDPWVSDTGALSFSCGQPKISQDDMARAAFGAAQRLAAPGWLTQAFLTRRERWLAHYRMLTSHVAVAESPEADYASDGQPVVSLPARDDRDAVELYSPRIQFRRSYLASEFADELRAAQMHDLRRSLERHDPTVLIRNVESDVEALHGRTTDLFLTPVIEATSPQGFATHELLAPELRVQGTTGFETWCGITPSVGGTFATGVQTVPVLELPDRMVLGAFRLELSVPVELGRTVLSNGEEEIRHEPIVDLLDDADGLG
jgi:hypothetical protein